MKTAVMAAVAGLSILYGVNANPVRVTFSGTYTGVRDPAFSVLFGIGPPPVPFEYSLTYDTSRNTSPFALLAGTTHNGHVLAEDFIGYSASGIIATSFTFGSKTWAADDLSPRGIDPATLADFWLNADIRSATPTAVMLYLQDPDGALLLGDAWAMGGTIHFYHGTSRVEDFFPDFPAFDTTNMTITRVDLGTVPDGGGSVMLVGMGLLLLGAANWCRKRGLADEADSR